MPKVRGAVLRILLITLCISLVSFFICEAALVFVSPHPLAIRLNLAAGKSASGEIEITNPSVNIANIRAYVQDFAISEKGGISYFARGSQKNSCAKWLEINPERLTLPPKGKAKVAYTIRVPQDVKGSYYAVIFFENSGEQNSKLKGVGIRVSARMGSYMTVMITGTTKRSYSEMNVEVSTPKENKPLIVTYSVKDLGNVDILVKGEYNILDGKGNFFGRGTFDRARAMPGGQIKRSSEYVGILPAGKYTLVSTFQIGPDAPLDTVVKETQFSIAP